MKTTEQLDTFTNVNEEINANSSLEYESTHIENTPFTIIRQGNEYFSTIGSHRITEKFLSYEICEQETTKITWDRLVQVIWAITEQIEKVNKLKENTDE